MPEEEGNWERLGRMNLKFYEPLDAGIIKVVMPDGSPDWLMIKLTLGSGEEIQDVLVFKDDGLKLVSLLIQSLADFGDPAARGILKMFAEHWTPPAAEEQ